MSWHSLSKKSIYLIMNKIVQEHNTESDTFHISLCIQTHYRWSITEECHASASSVTAVTRECTKLFNVIPMATNDQDAKDNDDDYVDTFD